MPVKEKNQEEEHIEIFKSRLVPKSKILSEEDTKKFLDEYNISKQQLPNILLGDPVVKLLNAKAGDVIEFERTSRTAGLSKFYRVVIGGI